MTSRTPRLLAVLLAGALVLGACGDDDGADEADDTTTTTEASEPTDDGGTDGDETGDDEGTTGGGDDEGDDGATDDGGSSGGDGFNPSILAAIDDFCALDEVGDEAFDSLFSPDDEDPAKRREAYEALGAFYVRAVELAPAEIESDLAAMIGGIEPLFELLADHDYDFMALYAAAETDPEVAARLEALDDPALEAAGDRVDAWVDANCDD